MVLKVCYIFLYKMQVGINMILYWKNNFGKILAFRKVLTLKEYSHLVQFKEWCVAGVSNLPGAFQFGLRPGASAVFARQGGEAGVGFADGHFLCASAGRSSCGGGFLQKWQQCLGPSSHLAPCLSSGLGHFIPQPREVASYWSIILTDPKKGCRQATLSYQ